LSVFNGRHCQDRYVFCSKFVELKKIDSATFESWTEEICDFFFGRVGWDAFDEDIHDVQEVVMARSGQRKMISLSKGLVLMVVFVDCNQGEPTWSSWKGNGLGKLARSKCSSFGSERDC
jgi:hypothetical protein